jgi:hypothetical protein
MHKSIRPYSFHNLHIFNPGLFICAIFYVTQVQVGIYLGSLRILSCLPMPINLRASSRSLRASVFIVFSPHVPSTYTFALEKLSQHSLRKRRNHIDSPPRSIVALNPALPSYKMLVFVFLFAMFAVCTSNKLSFCSVRLCFQRGE